MAKSGKYEKYLVRRPAVLREDGTKVIAENINEAFNKGLQFDPKVKKASDQRSKAEVGPIAWCDTDLIKGVPSIVEEALITGNTTLSSGPGEIGVAHKHSYDEIFLFLGVDSNNMSNLGCEIEYWIGEGKDLEKLDINTPSCLFMPAGLAHHPMVVKNLKTPLRLYTVMLNTPERVMTHASQDGRPEPGNHSK
jgi:hypothetical protein